MQILRLTTPKLHPKEHRSLFGGPELRSVWGPFPHPSDENQSLGTPVRSG
jgi:hypothetical protein